MYGMINKVDCYGVELTDLQNMEFSIYKSNSNLPSMNTISKEERKRIVLNWLQKDFYCKDKLITNATEDFEDYIPCEKQCYLCKQEIENE